MMEAIADAIGEALAPFGATFVDGRIVRHDGKVCNLVRHRKGRIQVLDHDDKRVLFSTPTPSGIARFVAEYYFWAVVNP